VEKKLQVWGSLREESEGRQNLKKRKTARGGLKKPVPLRFTLKGLPKRDIVCLVTLGRKKHCPDWNLGPVNAWTAQDVKKRKKAETGGVLSR